MSDKKLSTLLREPGNTFLSDMAYCDGSNNVVGGIPAQVISYDSVTKTIRLKELPNTIYGDDTAGGKDVGQWKASYYVPGKKIYIITNCMDDNPVVKTIVNATPVMSGTDSTASLIAIDIELDSAIELSQGKYDPVCIFYSFTGRSLDRLGTSPYRQMKLSASTLGCVAGTEVTVMDDDGNIIASSNLTKTWDGDNLTILFNKSQSANLSKKFYISGSGGLDNQISLAFVSHDDAAYTTHMVGEYNLGGGANSSVSGNGNVSCGDFSSTNGMWNITVSMTTEVNGTQNIVYNGLDNNINGTGNIVRGCNISVFGRMNKSYFDDNFFIGGLNEAFMGGNFFVGNANRSHGRSNSFIGSNCTGKNNNGTFIGRRLESNADGAMMVGQNGEIPEFEGAPLDVTKTYAELNTLTNGGGVHYKNAFVVANGDVSSGETNRIVAVFAQYRWELNPLYPFGNGNSLDVCPNAPGAGAGITAQDLRDKTNENPIILKRSPALILEEGTKVHGLNTVLTRSLDVNTTTVFEFDPSYTVNYFSGPDAIPSGSSVINFSEAAVKQMEIGSSRKIIITNGHGSVSLTGAYVKDLGSSPSSGDVNRWFLQEIEEFEVMKISSTRVMIRRLSYYRADA